MALDASVIDETAEGHAANHLSTTEHGEARSAPVRMYCAKAGIRGVFDKGARWKARWCVVKDGELSVYKQQGSAQAQWRFSLQGAETRQIFADDARVVGCKFISDAHCPFLLEISPRVSGAVLFAYETEEELECWIAAIERQSQTASDPTPAMCFAEPARENGDSQSQTWNARCQAALDAETSGAHCAGAVAEVVGQFITEVQQLVATIVDEYFSPREFQKFPSLLPSDFSHHGYQLDESLKSLYFENDVLYRVLNVPPAASANTSLPADDTAEDAVGMASQELLGTRLYRNGLHCGQLRTPLTVMISHGGFWVSAVAVLPISPASEVYSVQSGVCDRRFLTLLEHTMAHCGFGCHPIGTAGVPQGSQPPFNGDLPPQLSSKQAVAPLYSISTGLDVTGYRGEDGRFYLANLQRVCPADVLIGETATANPSPAFGTCPRFLRPELVQAFQREYGRSLSSNCYLPLGHLGPEQKVTNEEYDWQATRASRYLRENAIPRFMKSLNSVESLPCSGGTLTTAMHAAGINMRYLGLLAEHASVPHVYDLIVVEMVARQAKILLKRYMIHRQLAADPHRFRVSHAVDKLEVQRWQQQQEQLRRHAAVGYFKLLLGNSRKTDLHWKNELLPAVARTYGTTIERQSVQLQALACELQSACGIELRQNATVLSSSLAKTCGSPDPTHVGQACSHDEATRGILRDGIAREAALLALDAAAATGKSSDDRNLEADPAADFSDWIAVVKQPWIEFPFSVKHILLTLNDLDTAIVHPRGELSSQFQKRGGTCFPEESIKIARSGSTLRKIWSVCRQCTRRDAQLRFVGDITLAVAAIGDLDEALLLIEEAEVQLVRGRDGGEVGRLLLVIANIHFTAGAVEAARQYCLKGVQATISHWGPHHPLLLELYGLLAELATFSGDRRSCLAHRQACLAVATAALGLQHLATACYANAVGVDSLKLSTGDPAEAVGHHARALFTFETKLGRVHPGTAACAYFLAAALSRAGNHSRAATVAKAGADCRRALLKKREQSTTTCEERAVLLIQSLAQVVQISETRRDFHAASDAFQELVAIPFSNNAALESLECAAAATLRVCLRTQVPLELAAVVQATPALSTAAAAADKLFQQGFVGDLDGQKPTAKRQHALCHVAVRVARHLCLARSGDPSPNEYLLLLTRLSGVGTVGDGYSNIVGVDQERLLRQQNRASAASMELGCIRVMLANDARACELVQIAATLLAAEEASRTTNQGTQ